MNRPILNKTPDLNEVMRQLESYLDEEESGYVDDDTDHYIMEALLEAFYGHEIFEYLRSI